MNRIIIGSNAAKRKLVTGGLSKPSKMPGYAYNLPTHACIVGTKLRDRGSWIKYRAALTVALD